MSYTTNALAILETAFDISVSGRTISPVGALTISGVGYRADALHGSLTLTSGGTTTYDLAAYVINNDFYGYCTYPLGTTPVSTGIRKVGTVIDYPSVGRCQVLLSPTLATLLYVGAASDGYHIHPTFAQPGWGAATFGQLTIESGTNSAYDLLLFCDSSGSLIESRSGRTALEGNPILIRSNQTGGTGVLIDTGGDTTAGITVTCLGPLLLSGSGASGSTLQGSSTTVQAITAALSLTGTTSAALSASNGNTTVSAAGTGHTVDVNSPGAASLRSTAAAVSATGVTSAILQATGGTATVSASSTALLTSTAGVVALVASAAGQYIITEADTLYFDDRAGAVNFGYVNSAAMHHNTLVSAPTKSFRIPHPTKPDMILEHNAVEMPEACVMHRGTVTLDATGKAPLVAPAYLGVLTDPAKWTVMLTAIGATPFACSYQYAGQMIHGAPNGTVSWLVIGMRQDVPPTVVEAPLPPGYDQGSFPYPARLNAMRDKAGATHLPLPTPLASRGAP